MTHVVSTASPFNTGAFRTALVLNFIWINVSEIFRYFVFVMPMMRASLPSVPDVAPMDFVTFISWGAWDLLLVLAVTTLAWFAMDRFGATVRNCVMIGTAIWGVIFVIFWFGLYNLGLAKLPVIAVALPLAWIEMIVATLIVRHARCSKRAHHNGA